MNELYPLTSDSIWIFGVISVSFLAGCVYRLCVILAQDVRTEDINHNDLEELNHRYDQEMLHVRQLHNELVQVKRVVESRSQTAEQIVKPNDLGIDPFKLARSGANIDALMSRCRLSRAEAELVFSVHGAGSGRPEKKTRKTKSMPPPLHDTQPPPHGALTA